MHLDTQKAVHGDLVKADDWLKTKQVHEQKD